jgi:hypothetical protein
MDLDADDNSGLGSALPTPLQKPKHKQPEVHPFDTEFDVDEDISNTLLTPVKTKPSKAKTPRLSRCKFLSELPQYNIYSKYM